MIPYHLIINHIASEVTTVRRYENSTIYLFIYLFIDVHTYILIYSLAYYHYYYYYDHHHHHHHDHQYIRWQKKLLKWTVIKRNSIANTTITLNPNLCCRLPSDRSQKVTISYGPITMDCNPDPVFSIPGFGIGESLIPGSRRDYRDSGIKRFISP